ncbi:MAG: NifB/NifX family molybdenum-iron cluster-binding protein [Desulfobacterales bacterium]
MKIAFSTQGSSPEDLIEPAFGRCRNFLIVDDERGSFRVEPNPGAAAFGGAGTRAAETLVAAGVDRVLTGSVGPKARAVLEAAGIAIREGCRGAIRDHRPAPFRDRNPAAGDPGPPSAAPSPSRSATGCCFCVRCGYQTAEDRGLPCFKWRCPRCGSTLERRFGR